MNDTDSVRFCGAVFDIESVNDIDSDSVRFTISELSLISNQ